jgi:hypothetical protein
MVGVHQIFYESDFVSVLYHEEENYIQVVWLGAPSLEKVKVGLQEVLSGVQLTKCKQVLMDNRQVKGSWASANEWIVSQWTPLSLKAGLDKVAFVVADNLLVKVSIDNLRQKLVNQKHIKGEKIAIFKTEEEAKAWLLA